MTVCKYLCASQGPQCRCHPGWTGQHCDQPTTGADGVTTAAGVNTCEGNKWACFVTDPPAHVATFCVDATNVYILTQVRERGVCGVRRTDVPLRLRGGLQRRVVQPASGVGELVSRRSAVCARPVWANGGWRSLHLWAGIHWTELWHRWATTQTPWHTSQIRKNQLRLSGWCVKGLNVLIFPDSREDPDGFRVVELILHTQWCVSFQPVSIMWMENAIWRVASWYERSPVQWDVTGSDRICKVPLWNLGTPSGVFMHFDPDASAIGSFFSCESVSASNTNSSDVRTRHFTLM